MIFVLLIVFFIDGLVDVFISGFIAQDPDGEEVIALEDCIFVYMKDDKAKIKKKIAFIKKKFGKIKKHQFFTTFKVPKDFSPTVIGNFSKGFTSLTFTYASQDQGISHGCGRWRGISWIPHGGNC
jgi:hypothetical protein